MVKLDRRTFADIEFILQSHGTRYGRSTETLHNLSLPAYESHHIIWRGNSLQFGEHHCWVCRLSPKQGEP